MSFDMSKAPEAKKFKGACNADRCIVGSEFCRRKKMTKKQKLEAKGGKQ
jgi:putative SOS response-associated peptidase YedK